MSTNSKCLPILLDFDDYRKVPIEKYYRSMMNKVNIQSYRAYCTNKKQEDIYPASFIIKNI